MVESLTRRIMLGGTLTSLAACEHSGAQSYLRLAVDSRGLPAEIPYITEISRPPLALSLVGTVHSRDPDNPMFGHIEARVRAFSPDLVIHENLAPPAKTSRDEAIRSGGDIGHIVHLARLGGLPTISGDLPEAEEFPRLAAEVGVETALVFLVVQRLLVGLEGDLAAAEQDYQDFYRNYLLAGGLPVMPGHENWTGFVRAFGRVQGQPLSAVTWDPELTSPLRRIGSLNAVSRRSHALRDRRLREVIVGAFQSHCRVLVVFGAWHVMALEPLARSGRLFG